MKKDSIDEVLIPLNDLVKVTKTKHIIRVQHMEKMNTRCPIKKLDKDTYVNLDTGEIGEFEHIENRQQSYSSLRQTFKKLQDLINNNFEGAKNELHATLTYKENMTDTKRLYKDFDAFMKRLKYKYKNDSSIDYINVIEPQERGAWHCHLLLRFNDIDEIYIKNKDMRELWGNGFVTIKALENVDNIGAYLSAYLTDIELTEENALEMIKHGSQIQTKVVEGKEKKFVKGGRLHMYPPGMNLYRSSKGIEVPEQSKMRYKSLKKIVGTTDPHFKKSIKIETDDFSNTITYEDYNMKRINIETTEN